MNKICASFPKNPLPYQGMEDSTAGSSIVGCRRISVNEVRRHPKESIVPEGADNPCV